MRLLNLQLEALSRARGGQTDTGRRSSGHRSSPSCLSRQAQRKDFFHGLPTPGKLLRSVAKNSPNRLYYGDNPDVLRLHVLDESVDLVYLDPPFNSNVNYNVLFAERDGTQASAQIKAFEAGGRVSQAMQAFRTFLGESDVLAYLAMMAPRLATRTVAFQ